MLHFPTLRKRITAPAQVTAVMTDFITKLTDNFASRLDGLALPIEVMHFAKDPITVATDGDLSTRAKEVVLSVDQGMFIQELCTNGPAKFWSKCQCATVPKH